MCRIFSSACQVLIWLGEEIVNDSRAFEAVAQIDLILSKSPLEGSAALVAAYSYLSCIDEIPSSSWSPIHHLLERPWFQRVWIIQEVINARSAQLFKGSTSIAWLPFTMVMEKFRILRLHSLILWDSGPGRGFQNIGLMVSGNQGWRSPFSRFLNLTRGFKSTDPRDKIFALLGITDTSDMPEIKVDYGITVADIFICHTTEELEAGSLDHLSATNYEDDVVQVQLPAWVPDWSRLTDQLPYQIMNHNHGAGGSTIPRLRTSRSEKTILRIHGKRISCITRLSTTRWVEIDSAVRTLMAMEEAVQPRVRKARYLILSWLDQCHMDAFGDDFVMTREFCTTVKYRQFCQTMYSNNGRLGGIAIAAVDRLTRFYFVLVDSLAQKNIPPPEESQIERDCISTQLDIGRILYPLSGGRYFCRDHAGRLGWAPRRARIGDMICIFNGADIPHLLRPVADNRYELIGECYLQGCEDGALMNDDTFVLEEFAIV